MAIAPFPHEYTVSFDDGALRADPRPPIPAGPPPQFGGTDKVWSPEELLVAAVLLCVKTTFDAFALGEKLAVKQWRGTGTGTLVKSATGPVFSGVSLRVELVVPAGEEEHARQVLERAERRCIISAAIKAPVTLLVSVSAG